MMTVQELQEKQAKELAKLQAEQAIASLAPIPPRSVMLTSVPEKAWISYEAADLWAPLDILDKFQPLAMRKFKGTYTRFQPDALADAKRGEEVGGPYLAALDVSQGEGFGPTVTLFFFARLGDDICKVRVQLRSGYNDRFGMYGAAFVPDSRGMGKRLDHRDSYRRGTWRENGTLYGMADSAIKWGSGDDKSAHFCYYIMADNENADGTAESETHGRPCLENIANAMHGERKEVTSC
jgi:hypothetical protein